MKLECLSVSSFEYRRSDFDCEILLIVNYEFFHNSQSKESQFKDCPMNITHNHTPSILTASSASTRWIEHSCIFARVLTFAHTSYPLISCWAFINSSSQLPTPSCHQRKWPWWVTPPSHFAARSIVRIWHSTASLPHMQPHCKPHL